MPANVVTRVRSRDWHVMAKIGSWQQANANMDAHQPSHPSHLFTLRLWLEELGDGRKEWRGQVRHVTSGEARYFRDWQTLVEHLKVVLACVEKAKEKTPESKGGQEGES